MHYLSAGIVDEEEAFFLREQPAVSEAEIEALRRGDGVTRRCHDSRRRHFFVLLSSKLSDSNRVSSINHKLFLPSILC